jgi:peroxiredoxin Q/BCP
MPEQTKLQAGDEAPEFAAVNQNDQKVALEDFAGHWLVLYFYPHDDTPGCTTEACDFTADLREFAKLDATVLGVSPDSTESHLGFIAKQKIRMDLLSDPDKKMLTTYGAWGIKKLYGKEREGVIRSTFIIDPKSKIAHAWYNVRAIGHADRVKSKLSELAAR